MEYGGGKWGEVGQSGGQPHPSGASRGQRAAHRARGPRPDFAALPARHAPDTGSSSGAPGRGWAHLAGMMGEYRHAIDEKGRLTLPARIREQLGPEFVATKGLDGCLFLYPSGEWAALESRLRALPVTQKDARAFVRLLFAGACECRPDAQGRVLLPATLREYAGLGREGVIVGVSSRVEVWQPEAWERYVREADATYAEIAERMGGLGL